MPLFNAWCKREEKLDGRKRLWKLREQDGAREKIRAHLAKAMLSHYDCLERILVDVERLGYKGAAEILRAKLPQGARARSGDLGEILATELVEEATDFSVPIRRLRYKDGREMAIRGDDFIGVAVDHEQGLRLLKGESKSRKKLAKTTIDQARKALERHHGRCTPDSLVFVADRLLEDADVDKQELGRAIRDEVGLKALRSNRIDHMLFTLSGNDAPKALIEDWKQASTNRNQYVVNVRVEDHGGFVKTMFDEVQQLGDE